MMNNYTFNNNFTHKKSIYAVLAIAFVLVALLLFACADTSSGGGDTEPIIERIGPSPSTVVTHSDFSKWKNSNTTKNGVKTTTGTPISTQAELAAIAQNLAGTYYLTADIILTGNWTPLGSDATAFTGELHGNGYIIKGLSITSTVNNTGLFKWLSGATIDNLGIAVTSITTTAVRAGALAGFATESSTIKNIAVGSSDASTNKISGTKEIAGIIGTIDKETLVIGHNLGLEIEGNSNVHIGGVVAEVTNSTVYGTNTANITSIQSKIGGLIGEANGTSIIMGVSSGTITGINNTGGLVGSADDRTTITGVSAGNVVTSGFLSAGLVGGTTLNCIITGAAWGNVTSTANQQLIGGFVPFVIASLKGYALGWVTTTETNTNTTLGNLIGDNGLGLPTQNINVHGQLVAGTTDRVGSSSGNTPRYSNKLGVMHNTAPGLTPLAGLTAGTAVGEWTYSAGKWPKLNLPPEVTEILDLEPAVPAKPANFVD